jgi:hypothetical protein
MKKAIAVVAFAAIALPSQAQDAERGRALYEMHCTSCHYEKIHKRDASRSLVRSLPALRAEVARRAALVSRRLSLEDLDEIVEYLNRSHYKLDK